MDDLDIDPIAELEQYHLLPGPLYQRLHKLKATRLLQKNEVEAIYNLTESHSPGFRLKNYIRYIKSVITPNDCLETVLSNNLMRFQCQRYRNSNDLLEKLEVMPEEWIVIQLTSGIDKEEPFEIDNLKYFTTPIYLSVFQCGQRNDLPFCVHIEAPRDKVNGEIIQLAKEMNSIIADNKEILTSVKPLSKFPNSSQKYCYLAKRKAIDERLKKLIKDLQELWLQEWRCLLTGKFTNKELEQNIKDKIVDYLQTVWSKNDINSKQLHILLSIIKYISHLKVSEINSLLYYCFPKENRTFRQKLALYLHSLSIELSLENEEKYPLILVIDDNLDGFPWEMIDILANQEVTRVPSLYFLYTLYEQHKDSIVDGYKIIQNPNNGAYILNPDLNLPEMDKRMRSFLKYWTPNWNGIIGRPPQTDEIKETFESTEIFCYMGHGCGLHLISTSLLQKIKIKPIVLLFGCSSSRMIKIGPQVEMHGYHQLFLMSSSPCVIGMLWDVTDLLTDELTTGFLSLLIPTKKKIHWKFLDKSKWKKGEQVDFDQMVTNQKPTKENLHEPSLLKALMLTKSYESVSNYYLTKAACVARGIPVKIQK